MGHVGRPAVCFGPYLAQPGGPAPVRGPAAAGDDLARFSDEEKQALADLELLPLPPSVKDTIRDAMKAGFVRARQDFGRS